MQIERDSEAQELKVNDDATIYTKTAMSQRLDAIEDATKSLGAGFKLKYRFWGLLGFIRLTGCYYMIVITKRSQVAILGGHYIYQVEGTDIFCLGTLQSMRYRNTDSEESRLNSILQSLDLTQSFYFSYSYDLTQTLQKNIQRQRYALVAGFASQFSDERHTMFVWNHHLLSPVVARLHNPYEWCIPIIHGFVDQANLCVHGRNIHLTLLARRSRHFAGARFLKRGANDRGYVANDVETEQIVSNMLTTAFHAPGPKLFANSNYTSYVQHRGSIPLYWSQDNSGVSPKPGISLNLVDPFFTAAGLHFNDLFVRYGVPIYVLNLVKSRERTPRESILLREFTTAVAYLNQFLPCDKKIIYRAWDMSRASKSQDQDVIETLDSIARDVLATTQFFHNGSAESAHLQMQHGVARTNCIDCLDRTNAAQFVIGKRALGLQLRALGVTETDQIEYDTDAVDVFMQMFHDHGDTIAIQYGGSHLVNTMETYRKINQWTSHSRDMVESFKRYYNNSFLDKQRQEAYNLFLGNYIYVQGQPLLWDLTNDLHLHHTHPRIWTAHRSRKYSQWFDDDHLRDPEMPPTAPTRVAGVAEGPNCPDDYWMENYRPMAYSSFARMHFYKMNSAMCHHAIKPRETKSEASPLQLDETNDHDSFGAPGSYKAWSQAKRSQLKHRGRSDGEVHMSTKAWTTLLPLPMQDGLNSQAINRLGLDSTGSQADPYNGAHVVIPSGLKDAKDKALITQWTLAQFFANSLHPQVTEQESHEYQRYVDHPLSLTLAPTTDEPSLLGIEFAKYVETGKCKEIDESEFVLDEVAELRDFLLVGDEPLSVCDADAGKKRYKAYAQWMKGKSLFKQRLEP